MTSRERRFRFTRRRMLMQAAVASGVSALFKMTGGSASAQETGAGRGGPGGLGMGAAGRGGQPVHYGPMIGPVNKLSAPSDLRVTDMRVVTVASNYDYNIIRLDTNQGVYGLGEVRDAGSKTTVLELKPYVVGRNPLDMQSILRSIRPMAGPGRQGGGYSAINLALHDLSGKVFGVPAWRLLGDKKRDRVRMYCDTTDVPDPKKYRERMLELVTGVPKPFIDKGYITVPDVPGLGIELNEPVIKEHLRFPGYFEPTTEWDKVLARPAGATVGYPHFDEDGNWVTGGGRGGGRGGRGPAQ